MGRRAPSDVLPKLSPATPALVPLPEKPCSAGRRVWPSGSRTGRGTICAKSMTSTRMPNSISRERLQRLLGAFRRDARCPIGAVAECRHDAEDQQRHQHLDQGEAAERCARRCSAGCAHCGRTLPGGVTVPGAGVLGMTAGVVEGVHGAACCAGGLPVPPVVRTCRAPRARRWCPRSNRRWNRPGWPTRGADKARGFGNGIALGLGISQPNAHHHALHARDAGIEVAGVVVPGAIGELELAGVGASGRVCSPSGAPR